MTMHLATTTDLAPRIGSVIALCGVAVEPVMGPHGLTYPTATSRVFLADCEACCVDCACSSAPTPCDICADLIG